MVPGRSYGGMAENTYTPTASWSTYGSTVTSTASCTIYSNVSYSNVPYVATDVETFLERIFDKGKFFQFRSSMEFRAWSQPPVIPKKKMKARHGHQQMCRLPCYRGVRTR